MQSILACAPALLARMKLSLDPCVIRPRDVTAESLALAWWYDSKPAVRRLWGIQEPEKLRVIVAVEPTHDNGDIYPAWLAYADAWAAELHSYTGRPVQLELIREAPCDGIEITVDSVVVADLYWRDATLNRPYEVL